MLQRFIYFLFKPPWTIIGKIFGKGKKVGEEEGEEQKQEEKIYHNRIYRNRDLRNKFFQKGDYCIFGCNDKLYYKEIKKNCILREEIITRSITKYRLILSNEAI